VAAARLICVDTVGDSRKFALHCSSFLDFKIVRCASGQFDSDQGMRRPSCRKNAERGRVFKKEERQ
jgi:hypothetical protein